MKRPVHFQFRLYVAGDGPSSAQAIANLDQLCREHLPERHQIEIVDVLCEPQRALIDGVMLTPLLMKLSPVPVRQIVGSLSKRDLVLQELGLPATG